MNDTMIKLQQAEKKVRDLEDQYDIEKSRSDINYNPILVELLSYKIKDAKREFDNLQMQWASEHIM